MTTGQYMAVVAVNRAIRPKSKRSMWEWFSQTALLRFLPLASKAALVSQRFCDHMERMDADTAMAIWKRILARVVKAEDIDLSSISYDGTNFLWLQNSVGLTVLSRFRFHEQLEDLFW